MATNTKENGFEKLIVDYLVDTNHYLQGNRTDFNKEFAIDEQCFWTFLKATQQSKLDAFHLPDLSLEKRKFLTRLRDDISKYGIIYLLRKGFKYLHLKFDLYYALPTPENEKAVELYNHNCFSVTRQVQYSSTFPILLSIL